MVDATMGHGGHSFLFGQRLGPAGTLVGLDVDSNSLERARQRLAGLGCRVVLIRSNFSRLAERLGEFGIKEVHFVLADLGLCSAQLVDRERGLSFRADMPLDMRIDASLETTAADIVNSLDEKSLADLIYRFGQDRASRRIARYIVTSSRCFRRRPGCWRRVVTWPSSAFTAWKTGRSNGISSKTSATGSTGWSRRSPSRPAERRSPPITGPEAPN